MKDIYYYRTFSFPEIWQEFFDSKSYLTIPDGFELKEKPDHAKKRLDSEIEDPEKSIETYKKYLTQSEKTLEKLKKERKELD